MERCNENLQPLWTPKNVSSTNMDIFRRYANDTLKRKYETYKELYNWSVEHYEEFWSLWIEWGNFIFSKKSKFTVDTNLKISDLPVFFPDARLNFAENLLKHRDEKIALQIVDERGYSGSVTYSELYRNTLTYARSLQKLGITKNARVVGYIPNCVAAVEAMLGTATIGAIWSCTSPEFGVTGVLERFSQIEPKVLFTVDAVIYNGKCHSHLEKVKQVGTLIQIAKEHILHCNISREDVLYFYTTTGWMMWNWLITGLFSGCSLVLYDGSPLMPSASALWDMVDLLGITILGTSAKWLAVLEDRNICPIESHGLASLRAILCTGSPLPASAFDYVYIRVKSDVMLGSVSGGTDIISCFVGCNPVLPVYHGQIQCRLLGMAVCVYNEDGQSVLDESGELVCVKPFPSMPTCFWNDNNNTKYMKAYFSGFKDVWTHGDFCTIKSSTGGIVIHGRSDGTLNPNGVRFGSSEIYSIVENLPEVDDSLCVAQRNADGQERVILFLKLNVELLSEELRKKILSLIRLHLSARHIPEIILPIKDIPYTVSGKKVELAVRQVIHGQPVKNISALRNPESLALFENIYELKKNWF